MTMTKDKLVPLTEDERQLLAACRQMSLAARQAVCELGHRWGKGIGPFGEKEGLAWMRNRIAEIEAEGGENT